MSTDRDGRELGRVDQLPRAVYHFATPQSRDYRTGEGHRFSDPLRSKNLNDQIAGLPAPVNSNTDGSRRESWRTPNTMDHLGLRSEEGVIRQATGARDGREKPANLREQVDPKTCQIYKGARGISPNQTAKLNPRWVETLMGLPLGWTSPDCPASVILNWPKFVGGWLKAQTGQTS